MSMHPMAFFGLHADWERDRDDQEADTLTAAEPTADDLADTMIGAEA